MDEGGDDHEHSIVYKFNLSALISTQGHMALHGYVQFSFYLFTVTDMRKVLRH